MTEIGKNIKKIRSVKKISQAQFAELFELNRGSVAAYEEGRAEPKLDTIIQIANYFSFSIDLLLNTELQANELLRLNALNEKLDKAHHFKKPSSKKSNTGIELVAINSFAEYIANISKRDYLDNLPRIDLPVTFKEAARAFVMNGSEMEYHQNGLHHGDILLCQLTNLKSKTLDTGKVYTFVLGSTVLTRRLSTTNEKELVLSTDDPNYENLTVSKKSILELWEVKGVYSTYLNPPKMIEERVMLLEKKLEELVKKLQ